MRLAGARRAIAKTTIIIATAIIVAAAVIGVVAYYLIVPAPVTEIKIAYIGWAALAGTWPCMKVVEMAAEEIGVFEVGGRPCRFKVLTLDYGGKIETAVSLAKTAAMEERVTFIMIEGRSEVNLAIMEALAGIWPEYPVIMMANGPSDWAITGKVLEDYERYKFVFRDFNPEPGHWAWARIILELLRDVVGARKIAIWYEGLAWTSEFREPLPDKCGGLGLKNWTGWAVEDLGFEKAIVRVLPPRPTVYVRPDFYIGLFDAMAAEGVEAIFYVSSWFTDTDACAKQWAISKARKIPLALYGGSSHTYEFWVLSGGDCLGVITPFFELKYPITPLTIPFLQKCEKRGIPVQLHVHFAYGDVFLFKEALVRAGVVPKTTEDFKKLIKAMEEVAVEYPMGVLKIQTTEKAPFFRSGIIADPGDPTRVYGPGEAAGWMALVIVQWRGRGHVVPLTANVPEGIVPRGEYKPLTELRP